jgi:hypothetical protein
VKFPELRTIHKERLLQIVSRPSLSRHDNQTGAGLQIAWMPAAYNAQVYFTGGSRGGTSRACRERAPH